MYERLSKRVQGRRDEGFTLIELLIVIVILGILAAIVVFAIGSTRGDSVQSACKTGYKSVELSAEAIKTKSGQYPAVLNNAGVPQTTAIKNDMTIAAATNVDPGSVGESGNPLLADAIRVITVTTTDDKPFNNGALLKEYVKSGDYVFQYEPVLNNTADNATTKVTGYTLKVGTLSSAGAFVPVTVPTGNTTDKVDAVTGCNLL